MPLRLHFYQLDDRQRRRARAQWVDAACGDGFRYELDRYGLPICRAQWRDVVDSWVSFAPPPVLNVVEI